MPVGKGPRWGGLVGEEGDGPKGEESEEAGKAYTVEME